MNNSLHLVAFDIPYPPTYGGIIDVFYKLKALSKIGTTIHLHCFQYHSQQNKELEKYCRTVTYYQRKVGVFQQLSCIPYIVKTRIHKDLIKNLNKDNFPILLEGIHTTGIVPYVSSENRTIWMRTHNIEQHYYKQLAESTKGLKSFYFRLESYRLKKYENQLYSNLNFMHINNFESQFFKDKYPKSKHIVIPPFHGYQQNSEIKLKNYTLFHGNLSVSDNEKAVLWLIENLYKKFPKEKYIVAGKNPSKQLKKIISKYAHIKLIANPLNQEMEQLIQEAKIHTLISFIEAGVKLKTIASLHTKGFLLGNRSVFWGIDNNENIHNISLSEVEPTYRKLLKTTQSLPKNITQFCIEKNAKTITNHLFLKKN